MTEAKQTNFRIEPESAEIFRKMCADNGMTQAQGFDHLIQVYEIDRAKSALPDRATDIEDFERIVKTINSAYLRSLELCNSAEIRAKEKFQGDLTKKDKIIDELQEKIADLTEKLSAMKADLTEAEKVADASEKIRSAAEETIRLAQKAADDKQAIAETLAKTCDGLEKKVAELTAQSAAYAVEKKAREDLQRKADDLQHALDVSSIENAHAEELHKTVVESLKDALSRLETVRSAEAEKHRAETDAAAARHTAEIDRLNAEIERLRAERM